MEFFLTNYRILWIGTFSLNCHNAENESTEKLTFLETQCSQKKTLQTHELIQCLIVICHVTHTQSVMSDSNGMPGAMGESHISHLIVLMLCIQLQVDRSIAVAIFILCFSKQLLWINAFPDWWEGPCLLIVCLLLSMFFSPFFQGKN